jgi:peptidoglycan/LPS O-acetylase OafA/YrhL
MASPDIENGSPSPPLISQSRPQKHHIHELSNRSRRQLPTILPLASSTAKDDTIFTSNSTTLIRQTASVAPHLVEDKRYRAAIRTYLRYRGSTFAAILDENGGAGKGFDALRLALAILILLTHCSWIVGTSGVTTSILNSIFHFSPETAYKLGQATTTMNDPTVHQLTGLGRPLTMSYLPMFFALSGFLVTGSALRTRRLLPFLGLRVLRLLPALFVEVTLSAIILGAIFTQLPISQYYTSEMFWSYFLNIVGNIHFHLPGVFMKNVTDVVNSNLWTLPWELDCYVVMSFMIVTRIIYCRKALTILFGAATICLIYVSVADGVQVVPAQVGGPTLVYYFVAGVLMFLWQDKIMFHEFIFLIFAVSCYILMMSAKMVFIYPLMLTYITVFIGLFPLPKFALIKSGDYSYGIYLYGFPVTQALVAGISNLHKNLLVAAPLAIVATGAFAALSWHGVEKHCLKLKRYFAPRSSKITETLYPTAFSR